MTTPLSTLPTDRIASLVAKNREALRGCADVEPAVVRFKLHAFKSLTVSTGRDYLIKGVLPRAGLGVAWGPPASGKSFWTFDVAMHVATGWRYHGRRVQQAPVVYVAGEGQLGFRKRIEAWRQHRLGEEAAAPPFYLIGEPLNLIDEAGELMDDVERQIGGAPPGLIVLDTLNRTLYGDENSSEDMGRYVAAAESLRHCFDCCVMVVHHCGVEGSRPRGHTSLSGAADAQFAVSASGDLHTVRHEKAKDGDLIDPMHFKLRQVHVGIDEDGDDLTSCVVEPVEAPEPTPSGPRLTRNQQTMLAILHAAGRAGIPLDEWNEKCREAGIGMHRRADLYDGRAALLRAGLICEGQHGWFVKS
ncbi:MAG: AAA family ATPase [Azospirillaceae bacterium]